MKNVEFCGKTSKFLLERCLFIFCIHYLNEKQLNQQVCPITYVENEICNSPSHKKTPTTTTTTTGFYMITASVMKELNKLHFLSLREKIKCTANKHRELNFLNWRSLFSKQSLFSITNTRSESLNINACCSNQYKQLLQFLKTGLFFWDELFKELFIWHDFMFLLNPAKHIRFSYLTIQSDIHPGYIHWTLTQLQLYKFQLNVSQYVCYIIWDSHWNKIIVSRFLKLTVLYIRIDESV